MGASYDQPGFVSRLPGVDMDAHDDAMTAAGSDPSRTPSPDNATPAMQTGVPNVGVVMSLSSQTGPGEGGSANMPGQNDTSAISPGPAQDYTSTGAGQGGNLTDGHRFPWQQSPGGR